MPSIETITTSDIVIPSRVATRERRPVVDTKPEPPAPPAVAVARMPEKVAPQPPVASYRTTDAVPLATLFRTSAPVELDADAIEDEIARILALLESDGADAASAEAVGPRSDKSDAFAPQSSFPALEIASTPLSIAAAFDSVPPQSHIADDAIPTSTNSVDAPPSSQAPASPTEVAARLANLIADHKSLLEEFAAATEHLGSGDCADDASEASLIAHDEHASAPVGADSAEPIAASGEVASHEEVDVPPPAIPRPPLPAWSSAAEASSATLRDPAVESLVRAIAAAQSYVPVARPQPPPPAKSFEPTHRTDDVAHLEPHRLPYTATPETEPARLNPVPGFLGGVAVSGFVGAALWAVLQA